VRDAMATRLADEPELTMSAFLEPMKPASLVSNLETFFPTPNQPSRMALTMAWTSS